MDNGPEQVVAVAPSHGSHVLKVAHTHGEVIDLRLVVTPRPHGLHIPGNSEPSTASREVTA